jgi:hypothetical protein
MLSKNVTLEVAVNPQRLLTSVTVHDREAGISWAIPFEDGTAVPLLAVKTI